MDEFEKFKPLRADRSMGPVVFSATNAQFLSTVPSGENPWKLWSADVHAERTGGGTKVFRDILFAEDELNVSIYGIEFEDGYPRELRADLASRQRAFIEFLRNERANDTMKFGLLRTVFSGYQYSVEYRATAAFGALLGSERRIGVGYLDDDGQYVLLAIEGDD